MVDIRGGLVLSKTKVVVTKDMEVRLNLLSDLHIGASTTDYDKLDLDLARPGRVLILGDVFDGILPADKKRFGLTDLHPKIQGRKDVVNAAVDWARTILNPVASRLDMISMGNHETALEKNNSIDPIQTLLGVLNEKRHRIHHGGYVGLHTYEFLVRGWKQPVYWTIGYNHGSGSSSTIPRVASSLLGMSQWLRADLYWMGHHHQRLVFPAEDLSATRDGVEARPVWYVATGGYMRPYTGQQASEIPYKGRQSSYAADGALRPMGIGGVQLTLRFDDLTRRVHVEATL